MDIFLRFMANPGNNFTNFTPMFIDRQYLIDIFSMLGEKLSGFGNNPETGDVIKKASAVNPWFTTEGIISSMNAVREKMLERNLLAQWLENYGPIAAPKNIGIVMAGNIPLVGFFDMLCVLTSGHACYIKPSSKDAVLMNYITGTLKNIEPELPLFLYEGQAIDAVIATGSDNTNRYFKSMFGNIPSILHNNRSSAGILTGKETGTQLTGLANDIFMYSGLGCRNVSRIFVPEGYCFENLMKYLSAYKGINQKYLNNFRQRLAVLRMSGNDFIAGPHFILKEGADFPSAISEIVYSYYTDISEAVRWTHENERRVQCVACDASVPDALPPRAIPLGTAQSPGLTDYPDDIDTMAFLSAL